MTEHAEPRPTILNMDEAHGHDADADAMRRRSDLPLADYECRHGRLEHDPGPPCGCWTAELAAIAPDDLSAELAAAIAAARERA